MFEQFIIINERPAWGLLYKVFELPFLIQVQITRAPKG
jgi:hypothetical protein